MSRAFKGLVMTISDVVVATADALVRDTAQTGKRTQVGPGTASRNGSDGVPSEKQPLALAREGLKE